MTARPPRPARALIGLLTPETDRAFALDDLDETFARIAEERGNAAARRWYRGQALRSLPLAAGALRATAGGRVADDLRSALRVVRRRPLYALGVAGTLSLGMASAIVLGGIAWRVWLQPLPFQDSEKLVRVYELGRPDPAGERDQGRISPPLLRDLQEKEWAHFSGFAGIISSTPEWVVEGELRQIQGSTVTPGFFELLGITPLHGRVGWTSRTGADIAEVILGESFWRQNFGADPATIGSSIDLGGVQHTVVGIVAQTGGYPAPVDVFTSLVFDEVQLGEGFRGARYMEVIGRVHPASSIEAGSLEMAGFIESLGVDHPMHEGWSGEVVSLREDLTGPFRNVLRILIAAGAAFLALALVNVIGLASTRALERNHEVGIRLTLGASTGRLVRGAWIEGAVLGALGGGVALSCALVVFPASVGWLPPDLARSGEVGLSWGGVVAWWAVALVAGGAVAVIGHRLVPASTEIRNGTRSTRDGHAGRILVAGQLALTTLLVGVGTIVFDRSLQLAEHDYGFVSQDVYSGFVSLPRSTHEDWEARRDSWDAIVSALTDDGIPAAITTNPPMSGMNSNYGFARPGAEPESFGQYSVVSEAYFDVMGIPIVAGRTFEPGESGPVALVSDVLVREHFPDVDPIGETIRIIGEDHTIIGVVGSTAHFGPDAPEPAAMYVSYEATNWDFAHLVARGGPSVGPRMVEAVERIAPGATAPSVAPYETHLSNWFRPLRIQLGIVGALGLIGGLLAGLGLYANIAYQVRSRLPELGIRAALGASRARILSTVVRQGLASAAVGLGGGLTAWWAARVQLGELLGSPESAMSPFALGMTSAIILGLTLLAVSPPAVRASRADPLESLRAD